MKTIICRVAFCSICAKEQRPKTTQDCLFYGSGHKQYYVRGAFKIGIPGFTPHIIKLIRVDNSNGTVHYERTCSMSECTSDKLCGTMTIKEWNAWTMYKHDPDYDI